MARIQTVVAVMLLAAATRWGAVAGAITSVSKTADGGLLLKVAEGAGVSIQEGSQTARSLSEVIALPEGISELPEEVERNRKDIDESECDLTAAVNVLSANAENSANTPLFDFLRVDGVPAGPSTVVYASEGVQLQAAGNVALGALYHPAKEKNFGITMTAASGDTVLVPATMTRDDDGFVVITGEVPSNDLLEKANANTVEVVFGLTHSGATIPWSGNQAALPTAKYAQGWNDVAWKSYQDQATTKWRVEVKGHGFFEAELRCFFEWSNNGAAESDCTRVDSFTLHCNAPPGLPESSTGLVDVTVKKLTAGGSIVGFIGQEGVPELKTATISTCRDGFKSGGESDVDCGDNGNHCDGCDIGDGCDSDSDCDTDANHKCTGGVCDLGIGICKDFKESDSSAASGVYTCVTASPQVTFECYCDMVTDGGGWTLIAKVNSDFDWFGGEKNGAPSRADLFHPDHQRDSVMLTEGTGLESGVVLKLNTIGAIRGQSSDVRLTFWNEGYTGTPHNDVKLAFPGTLPSCLFGTGWCAKTTNDYTVHKLTNSGGTMTFSVLCWGRNDESTNYRCYEHGIHAGKAQSCSDGCHLANDKNNVQWKSHYSGYGNGMNDWGGGQHALLHNARLQLEHNRQAIWLR